MKPHSLLATLFFSLVLLNGYCFRFSSAYANTNGLIEPQVIWNKTEVRICWAESPYDLRSRKELLVQASDRASLLDLMNATERAHLQNLVQTQYTLERTGITFTGWKSCSDPNEYAKADVVLAANSNGLATSCWGQSDIGLGREDSEINPDGTYKGSFFTKINEEVLTQSKRVVLLALHHVLTTNSELKTILEKKLPRSKRELANTLLEQQLRVLQDTTVIHEFGHLAGLRHEHARNDRDPTLHSTWQFRMDQEDQMQSAQTFNTPYDPLSIMNYNHSGVVKSLFAAQYLCKSENGKSKRNSVELTREECAQLDTAIRSLGSFTVYDRAVLKMAYVQNAEFSVQPQELELRALIQSIVQKMKNSEFAPEHLYGPGL